MIRYAGSFYFTDYVVGIMTLYKLLKMACLYKNSPETPGKLFLFVKKRKQNLFISKTVSWDFFFEKLLIAVDRNFVSVVLTLDALSLHMIN